jgi:hypothetical protein
MSMFNASDPSPTSLLPLCPTGSTQRERIDRPSTWSEDLGVIDNSSQAIHHVAVLALPLSQIFDLIFTFPLLEDLALNTYDGTSADNGDGSGRDEIPTATQPLTPPTFTGSLDLSLWGEMKPFTRRLLSLVGGIHFRKLTVRWYRGDTHVLDPYRSSPAGPRPVSQDCWGLPFSASDHTGEWWNLGSGRNLRLGILATLSNSLNLALATSCLHY